MHFLATVSGISALGVEKIKTKSFYNFGIGARYQTLLGSGPEMH
jgi:hypothetical protein